MGCFVSEGPRFTINVNVDSPNRGFPYFLQMGGQIKTTLYLEWEDGMGSTSHPLVKKHKRYEKVVVSKY